MIYVTHDQVEAMTMADNIVVLRDGRVEQIGVPLELYNHPANRFVAGFIGAPRMNFLAGRATATGVALNGAPEKPVALAAEARDQAVVVGVRPEAIGVSLDGDGDAKAIVRNFEQLGAITYIYSELASGEPLTVQLASQIPLNRGQEIGVSLPADSLHVFADDDGRGLTAARSR